MYCRYCTRRRFSGQIGMGVPKKQLDDAIAYISETPQVRDVLISGGDGLLINDKILEYVLKIYERFRMLRLFVSEREHQ